MSRSQRKTPIVGVTTTRSEKVDKKIWHQVLRSRERTALTSASPDTLGTILPLLENDVINKWAMGKDGHRYWARAQQSADAGFWADRIGNNPQERAALKKRLLHKWMGK